MAEEPRTTTGTRKWISADQWLKATEDTPDVSFRSIARPVHPASDRECYNLNPPLYDRATSLRGYRTPPRNRRRADAEQAARQEAAHRIDLTSDMRLGGDS